MTLRKWIGGRKRPRPTFSLLARMWGMTSQGVAGMGDTYHVGELNGRLVAYHPRFVHELPRHPAAAEITSYRKPL